MTEVVYAISHRRKLLYIGRTNNFHRRQTEHLRNIYAGKGARRFRKAFRKVTFSDLEFTIVFDGSRKEVKRRERELILKHRPPGNTEFLDPNHEKKKRHYAELKSNHHRSRNHRNRYYRYYLRK
jgi:predicted GIY-YIG superfamily endonuclease